MTQKRLHPSAHKAKISPGVGGTDGLWAVDRARGIQNHGPLEGDPPWEMPICRR